MRTIKTSSAMMVIVCLLSIIGQVQAQQPAPAPELVNTVAMPNVPGRLGHMAYNSNHQLVYITALTNNSLEAVSLETNKIVKSVKSLRQPRGLVYIPETDMILVGLLGDATCRAFSPETFKEINSLKLDPVVNVLRYNPLTLQIFIGYGEGTVAIVDANAFRVSSSIKLTAHPESYITDEKSEKLFVNLPKLKEIQVFDIKSNVLKQTWKMEADIENYPMAFDQSNQRLFVATRNPFKILVLDSENGKSVTSFDIDGEICDMAYNSASKQLYVLYGDGYFKIFNQQIKEEKQVVKRVVKEPVKQAPKSKKGAQTKKPAPKTKEVTKEEVKIVKVETYEDVSKVFTRLGAKNFLFIPAKNQLVVAAPAASGKDAQLMVYQLK